MVQNVFPFNINKYSHHHLTDYKYTMNGIKVHYFALLCDDCSVIVYRSFTTIFHKCINIAINFVYIFPIMLVLCLMLLLINCAQNYVGIIDDSLHVTT